MTKIILLTGALLALSLWIGFEIDPERDWIAWLFIAVIPTAIIAFVTIFYLRSAKNGGEK